MVLWDNESFQLLKHTAANLKKLMIDVHTMLITPSLKFSICDTRIVIVDFNVTLQDGETNDMAIPAAVDDLVGKTLGFKVKVQPTYKRCSVVAITEDFRNH